jgi:hypothetical protein
MPGEGGVLFDGIHGGADGAVDDRDVPPAA